MSDINSDKDDDGTTDGDDGGSLVEIRRVLGPAYDDRFAYAHLLECPVCGDNYCRLGSARLISEGDYANWDGRGDVIEIPFTCETGGHSWNLCVGHHKGENFGYVSTGSKTHTKRQRPTQPPAETE